MDEDYTEWRNETDRRLADLESMQLIIMTTVRIGRWAGPIIVGLAAIMVTVLLS